MYGKHSCDLPRPVQKVAVIDAVSPKISLLTCQEYQGARTHTGNQDAPDQEPGSARTLWLSFQTTFQPDFSRPRSINRATLVGEMTSLRSKNNQLFRPRLKRTLWEKTWNMEPVCGKTFTQNMYLHQPCDSNTCTVPTICFSITIRYLIDFKANGKSDAKIINYSNSSSL